MKNQNDFINEMDDGYIDIESCFDPVFEPPAELLEEWSRRYEGPEPTLENTSFYVVGPETNCQGLFNQIHKKGARSTVWLLTPRLIDYIFPFNRSLQRYA